MKAKVTKGFRGRRDNEPFTSDIAVGETITGDLATVAVKQGWAKPEGAADEAPASVPAATEELVAHLRDPAAGYKKRPTVAEVTKATGKAYPAKEIEAAWKVAQAAE